MITPKKKWAKVFRDAARQVADLREWYCCDALSVAMNYNSDRNVHLLFSSLFKPEIEEGRIGWWGDSEVNFATEPRILALLLCAEICERGKF